MEKLIIDFQILIHKPISEKWFIPIGLIVLSLLMCVAWLFNWTSLLSLKSGWVTMKFGTALAFVFIGLQILFKLLRWHKLSSWFGAMLFISCVWTVTSFLLETPLNFLPHFEESGFHTESVRGDMPSWATLFVFAMAAITIEWKCFAKFFVGTSTILVGLPIFSYLIDPIVSIPQLRYYIPQMSTAMAFHTAIFLGHITLWVHHWGGRLK